MIDKDKEFKFIKPGEIRTRFAPSPTGSFHMGNARTALFNFLFARNQQGKVILRIEDTDKERSTIENEKALIEVLKWLGINWDEGPDIEGDFGPYRQSKRSEIYKKYLKKLLEQGRAYYCFCAQEELEAQRQYQMSIGQSPTYNGKCRELSKQEVEKSLKQGRGAIIRFKTPAKKIVFEDLVKGKIEIDTSLIGDFSIAKNINSPLYNFACVIDDFEMKISHVIRGDDHVSNTPKQILLYEALDLAIPKFGHLPMVLATDKSKLSKRKHGNVAVEDFKEMGYLPQALVNFLAFLGWNPGTEREIYSMASLVKEFSLEKVQKAGAVFNIKRLDYLNGFYIRNKSIKRLAEICQPYLPQADPGYIEKIVAMYQERLKKLSEISELTDFFFKEKLEYDKKLLKWKDMSDKEITQSLDKLEKILFKIDKGDWDKENLEKILMPEAEKVGDRGYLLWPFRVALTGKDASAGPFEIAEILGKEKTLKRLKEARGLF